MTAGQALSIFTASCLAILALFQNDAEAVEYTGQQFKDPFFYKEDLPENQTAENPSDATGAMVVEGLLWNTDTPQAIVNGRIVRSGDKIGEAEVMEISREGVKIRLNGNDCVLKKKAREAP